MKFFGPFLVCASVTLAGFGISALPLRAENLTSTTDFVVAADYPPLIVQNDAENPGLALEILYTAAERLNREISLEFLPFQRALYSLEQKPEQMTPALFRSPQREEQYTWVAPILSDDLMFMTFGPAINSFEEAKKLPAIAVESGSSPAQVLVQQGFENLVFVSTPQASIRMLDSQRVQAWFQTHTAGEAVWKELGFTQPLEAGQILHSVKVYLAAGLAFPSETTELYRGTIEAMHQDGTIAALKEKYSQRHE